MKKLLLLLAVLFCFNSFASTKSDSLNQVWNDESINDTIRCKAFFSLIWDNYMFNQPDTAFDLARQLYFFSQKKRIESYEYGAVYLQGLSLYYVDDYKRSIKYLQRYLDYQISQQNMVKVGNALNVIALSQKNRGNAASALEYNMKALKVRESLKDSAGIGGSLNNIGNIYYEQNELEYALDYYKRSYDIKKNGTNQKAIANSLNNIGLVLHDQGKLSEARKYYLKSLNIQKKLNYKPGIILEYTNLGALHEELEELDSALQYFRLSLEIAEEIEDNDEISNCLSNIAGIYFTKGEMDLALEYATSAIEVAKKIEAPNFIELSSGLLYKIYKKQGKGLQALEMYELHIKMRDSIYSQEVKKGLLKMEVKFEIEKERLKEEQLQKEEEQAALQAEERRNSLEYSSITMALFVLFGLLFLLGKFHLPNWLLELSVFLPFLILFEFLLVLFDPYVEAYASGDPMIKLLINACLAGLIFPLHSFFEKVLKRRLFKTA